MILNKHSGMWVGLFDTSLFELGLKLSILHEVHRIVTMGSMMSWSRFYDLPGGSPSPGCDPLLRLFLCYYVSWFDWVVLL